VACAVACAVVCAVVCAVACAVARAVVCAVACAVACAVYKATLHVSVTHNQWNSEGGRWCGGDWGEWGDFLSLDRPPVLFSKFISYPRYIWPSAVESV
jgi:hypothetical protein